MLTQERLVEIHVLETQGLSIRAIGRKLGVSRNTVRRYLRDRCLKPQYPCREVKPTKLDLVKGYIHMRMSMIRGFGSSEIERDIKHFKGNSTVIFLLLWVVLLNYLIIKPLDGSTP